MDPAIEMIGILHPKAEKVGRVSRAPLLALPRPFPTPDPDQIGETAFLRIS